MVETPRKAAVGAEAHVRPADGSDVDPALDYLCRAFPGGPGREQWRGLFERHWSSGLPKDTPIGYLLEANRKIVGYLATVCAARELGATSVISCNLAAWCVDLEHRAMGGALFLAAMRQRVSLFTALTPTAPVQNICEVLGFSCLAEYKLLFPVPLLRPTSLLRRATILTKSNDLTAVLSDAHRRIREDHARFALSHYVIVTSSGYSYLILRRTRFKRMRVSEVLFCSNPMIFSDQLDRFKAAVFVQDRSLALFGLPSFIAPQPKGAVKIHKPVYYKGSVNPAAVDLLYSELVLVPQGVV